MAERREDHGRCSREPARGRAGRIVDSVVGWVESTRPTSLIAAEFVGSRRQPFADRCRVTLPTQKSSYAGLASNPSNSVPAAPKNDTDCAASGHQAGHAVTGTVHGRTRRLLDVASHLAGGWRRSLHIEERRESVQEAFHRGPLVTAGYGVASLLVLRNRGRGRRRGPRSVRESHRPPTAASAAMNHSNGPDMVGSVRLLPDSSATSLDRRSRRRNERPSICRNRRRRRSIWRSRRWLRNRRAPAVARFATANGTPDTPCHIEE